MTIITTLKFTWVALILQATRTAGSFSVTRLARLVDRPPTGFSTCKFTSSQMLSIGEDDDDDDDHDDEDDENFF